MYKNKKFLAIIPARGGSKGVPKKNIKKLNGKPLIYYTIKAAKESKIFDKIIVSTDDKRIAEISIQYGASIPFLRPAYLATDNAKSINVILHAIKELKKKGEMYDYVMKLQPTSPLRKSTDILNATKLLFEKKGNSIISVSKCENHPLWTNTLKDNLKMDNFLKEEIKNKNRQELQTYYRINGAIYLSQISTLVKNKDWYKKNSYAYIMKSERSIDIDNYIDFKLAEILIKRKNDI